MGDEAAANRGTTKDRLQRRLKGDLDRVIGKAMAKAPQLRYQSAEAFADDLGRYLDNMPVEAGKPGAAYRLKKFAQRSADRHAISDQ